MHIISTDGLSLAREYLGLPNKDSGHDTEVILQFVVKDGVFVLPGNGSRNSNTRVCAHV